MIKTNETQTQDLMVPDLDVKAQPSQTMIEAIIADATTAPSGDNCQPWSFHWDGQQLLVLHSNTISKHSLNRKNHAAIMSFGAMMEAMRLSATQFGFVMKSKNNFSEQTDLAIWAQVTFKAADIAIDPLVSIVRRRCTDRRLYRGGTIEGEMANQLNALQASFPKCHLYVQQKQSASFIKYFLKTEKLLWKNSKIVSDLGKWLRLSKKEIEGSNDGMSWRNLAINQMDAMIFKLIRRFPSLPQWLWSLGFGLKINHMGRQAIQSSAGLICVTVKTFDADAYCQAGAISYRAWLILNQHGFGVQPMSYASTSVADMKTASIEMTAKERALFTEGHFEFHKNFGIVEATETPIWMFRTGLSSELPLENRTARRTVDEILVSELEGLQLEASIQIGAQE